MIPERKNVYRFPQKHPSHNVYYLRPDRREIQDTYHNQCQDSDDGQHPCNLPVAEELLSSSSSAIVVIPGDALL